MADNFEADAGSGGKTFASDQIGGVDYPRCKVSLGADGSAADALGGAGAVAAGVQRVTLASDDPAVALLGTIDADTSTIAGDTTSIDGKITACNTGAVVVASGAITETNSTAILADTANIDTNLGTVAGAVSGTEMQVDVVASLPAGTNAIGKLAANSGVDIGDVDVLSVVPGTAATNLGKAEDAGHTTGDVGVMALAVRQTADAPLSGADLDYEPLQTDENGYLKVNIKAGAGSGGTASTDDAAFTAGSGSGTPMMGFATSDTVDAGDVGVLAMDTARNLKVSLEVDSVGLAAESGGNLDTIAGDTTSIDGKITACNTGAVVISSGTVTETNSTAILADTANIDTNVGTIAGAVSGTEMQVDVVTSALPTGAATAAAQLPDGHNVTVDNAAGAAAVNIQDGGNSITVDGTITETNSTAILADTANMDTNLGTIAGDTTSIDGKITACNTGAVVVSSGAITETNSTAILADTASMDTNLGTIAGAVSGSEMQVDVVAALPAGTNAIGKLAANSGVDIGDVDVTSLPAAIQGPGNPVIDSYANIAINLTTGANQVLVSSAVSKQIWVYGYGFTCGDADGQTVSLQDEDDTAVTGIMEFAQYGGISVPPSGNFAMPVFKLATDKDLEIDITGGDVDGWLAYAIVSV